MYGNIVIAGGTTLCKGVLFVYFLFPSSFRRTATGFSERLRHELNAHVPRSVEINIVEDPNRHLATWIGKSCLFASISLVFTSMLALRRVCAGQGRSVQHELDLARGV
jgi:hypothetical protein